ncbi:MAG: PLU-1-like domain protein [Leptospiraceae bacterium]|nr:PLU-1-like domain protein [Leptospiraceae bacterium]
MEFPDLEVFFQRLTDVTDQIAIINTHYDADHEKDFTEMESIFETIKTFPWEKSDSKYYTLFTSYFTFHMKIVEEMIHEAREILNPEKRQYLKRLVNYSKTANDWFSLLKKRKKSISQAA